MSLRPPKIYKHKTQKKRTSGPKNSVRKRQVFEHNTKSLMNLRPQNFMNLRPQTKIVNPRLLKSCEPKANHAACSANASGGEALRPPPQPPSSCFFFKAYLQVKLSCGFGLVVWVFLITLYFDQRKNAKTLINLKNHH